MKKHKRKLQDLSFDQDKPALNTTGYLKVLDNIEVPQLVEKVLRFGPRHPVAVKAKENHSLANINILTADCNSNNADSKVINKINALTVGYVNTLNGTKTEKETVLVKKWLRDNEVLAVPYDKGTGFCLKKVSTYMEKCDALLSLPQFQKQLITKDPISTQEKNFKAKLYKMRKRGLISEEFYKKVILRGSQPARFYGLAKVHKKDILLRPIVSMPGSVYHKLSLEIAERLKKLPEANINTKVEDVQTALSALHLDDEEIVSLDVESLFTNVPVQETISLAADLLYYDENDTPDIDEETFVALLKMVSVNVMFTSRTCEYYPQIDGVAMSSPV